MSKQQAFPPSFRFDYFRREGKYFGRLVGTAIWQTEITGHAFRYDGFRTVAGVDLWVSFSLSADGLMAAYDRTEYDFGSGPAINDLCVIYASLPHDIGCHLTDMGAIPWKWRGWFDAFYRKGLAFYGCQWVRKAWQWAVVRSYSKFIAYHKRTIPDPI